MKQLIISMLTFLSLISIVYCENGLSKTNYTKDFFNDLKLVTCKKDEDCPDYSNGCYFPDSTSTGYCNIYLFCHKTEKCLKLSLGEFDREYEYRWPYYKTESYDYYQLTMNSCNIKTLESLTDIQKNVFGNITYNNRDDWGVFEDCKYAYCEKNSHCFSNKCNTSEELCEVDSDNPGYICTLMKYENGLHSVKCLLMNQEKCVYNSDCLSNICDSNVSLCVTKDSEMTLSEMIVYYFKTNYIKIIIIVIVILFVIGIGARIRKAKIKSKEVVFARMEY